MTAAETTPSTPARASAVAGLPLRAAVFMGTILVIIAAALLPLLTPWFIHPALEASQSAARLGFDAEQTRTLSDRSVQELLTGPGTFAFPAPDGEPFYDASERGHLGDARFLLWLFLAGGSLSLLLLAAALVRAPRQRGRAVWETVSRAGLASALAVVALGLVSVVGFGTLFRLFHQVFFPAGNWSFDSATQRLVQLYPFAFWQLAAGALGALVLLLGLATWWLGRAMARRSRATGRRGMPA